MADIALRREAPEHNNLTGSAVLCYHPTHEILVHSLNCHLGVAAMSDEKGDSDADLRQAKITTNTAKQMLRLLEGQDVEMVGRGPHQMPDGTYVAHVIATKQVLSKLPKKIGTVEVRPRRKAADYSAEMSQTNRYEKEGSVPHGVGIKE
jgi:hypothetical protein